MERVGDGSYTPLRAEINEYARDRQSIVIDGMAMAVPTEGS